MDKAKLLTMEVAEIEDELMKVKMAMLDPDATSPSSIKFGDRTFSTKSGDSNKKT